MPKKFQKLDKTKEVVDLETGEIYKVIMLIPEIKDNDFTKVYKACSKAVIQKLGRLNGAVYLLFWILDNLNYESVKVYIDPEIVAKVLNKSKRRILQYLKLLVDEGFLFKVPNKRNLYKINTNYFYKGHVKSMKNHFKSEKVQILGEELMDKLYFKEDNQTKKREEKKVAI